MNRKESYFNIAYANKRQNFRWFRNEIDGHIYVIVGDYLIYDWTFNEWITTLD